MKTINTFAALALTAILMAFPTFQASAQIRITDVSVDPDYNDEALAFARKTSKSHPGGWNFDLIGMGVSEKAEKGHKISPKITLLSGFGFGFTTGVNADPGINFRMGRSFNFCIEDIIAVSIKPWKNGKLSVGYGIDLHNYTLGNNQRFAENPVTKQVSITDPTTITDYSRIHTLAAATFNLKYDQYLGRGFHLAFGPELYIIGRKHDIRNRFNDENGLEQRERFTNIRTNKVGFNLVGILSYKKMLGVYTKYSPTNVIEPGFGPRFQSLSVGIMVLGL